MSNQFIEDRLVTNVGELLVSETQDTVELGVLEVQRELVSVSEGNVLSL